MENLQLYLENLLIQCYTFVNKRKTFVIQLVRVK